MLFSRPSLQTGLNLAYQGGDSRPLTTPSPRNFPPMASILTGSQITDYRAKVLLSALSLECKGMKRNGPSAYSLVKKEYNLRGNKQSVHDQLSVILAAQA